ncbi:MAG: elongation factor P [Phycisphaeraceae bacterium]|nr:elongation factor P [Phycisphaeraceae bacterium]
MKATDIRNGQAIRFEGGLYVVHSFEHRTPGNLRAFVQVKLKDIGSGRLLERRMNSDQEIDLIDLDRRPMEYLFSDSSGATFMDLENYDQIVIPPDVLGDALLYLAPNAQCVVLHLDGRPISLELPSAVEVTITETPPGIKGATATNQLKDATCDTGLKTKVPPFISEGERIRVSTADGSYMSRAKE